MHSDIVKENINSHAVNCNQSKLESLNIKHENENDKSEALKLQWNDDEEEIDEQVNHEKQQLVTDVSMKDQDEPDTLEERSQHSLENTQIWDQSIMDFDDQIGNPVDENLPFLNVPRQCYKSLLDYKLDYYLQWKYQASPSFEYQNHLWMQ